MKAESLYIQKLTYDENTGNEIIGLFPSEANPAIVSSYTYDAKRMGGAPTLTATIYSSEPLQWKKEEFVEYNGDRFFASYTPNSTKDNSSRMWKSEITFTSRRELLDNTLFFDVVVDDVDTQNKDRYRSNQTKFTFGGTIYEFVARINSSMAYCGLYRPTDEYKGYYVVVDEGYGTDEVKEVSFEDQYLTDVLQLINTTFELDYYWDGSVCHVGKVQHDLTDTPIKYGSSDALISVSKENANYKIVDMITGYGSSDNLPYYYPNDDEFGEAVFNTENFSKSLVSSISLGDVWKWNSDVYNNTLIFSKNSKDYYTANVFGTSSYLITNFGGKDYKGKGEESKNVIPTCSMGEEYTEHNSTAVSRLIGSTTIWTLFEFTSSAKEDTVKMDGLSFVAKEADSALKFGLEFSYEYAYYVGENTNIDTAYKSIQSVRGGGSMSGKGGSSFGNSDSDVSNGWAFGDNIDGLSNYTKSSKKEHTFERNSTSTIVIACKITATNIKKASGTRRMNTVSTSISGSIELTRKPSSVYYFETSDGHTQPYDESGIKINGIGDIPHKDLTFSFDGTYWNATEGGENNAAKITITDRVWLAPSSVLMPSIYRNTKGAERFYYALNNTHKLPSGSGYYEFVNLYKKGNPHQGTVTFGDIKPTIKGIVNAEGQLFGEIADIAFDSADSDVKDSDGKYIHNYFYIKLHKFNGDFGFDLFAHALASEPAKINLIKSNGCPACSFVIYNQPSADNSKCYNCVSVDENGNLKPVRTDKNDYIFANASDAYEDKLNQDSTQKELWIAVQKDTSTLGIIMPNASAGFKPQKGDLFVITGIKPPKVLVTAAEKRLDDALIKHMSENNTDQFNYSVKFSRIFLQENPDFASKLNENAKLSIQIQGDSDSDGNLISHEVFVSNYSVKVDNDELAEVEIELVNSLEVTKSDTKQIIDAVKGETVKSLSSMVGGSNTNSFNASITDKMYLSKLKDDTANGTITFQKIQKFLQGLLIGGGSWTPDAEGRSHLITDYLEVRMKAIFEELVINKTSTIGGKEIISPAGGVVAHKVEEVTVTYNNVSQKAYRCYFLAEQDGDEVDNDFAVNDQVRSESFNVRKGTYHKAGNHFYWRLVIGRDEDPVELEGKKYHYIDLSDTDCATASDVPAKGDVLNQCGNRTDVERQNCLIFSAVDTYSPSISLYHGINSYSFANREYVEYGVNKQTNKAFFNVYGDMYFGDRPTSANNYEGDSYVKYDSDKKKVTIKGDLDIKSTYDGKTLDKYITEKSLDKNAVETIIKKSETITDLQNQIDGAIETWFYDGVPTLSNAPAIGWTTDKDKKTHLGDLYYDNKTGKAYRFAKDGSTYKWIIITDTELTKAIEDSSQALKDAKSKRRIFGSQPVPPYDVNDMWVNATYPSDGSTYKNEILKCSTSKAEGEEFDIADWKLASKYTDDTKAEEAKKAAEKAQAEIKKTQTNLITLGTTVSNNKKAFDVFTSDGYLESSEIAAIAQDSKRLEDDYNAAVESYNNVVGSKFLLDKDGKETTYKTDLVSAKATLDSAKNELITYLSDIVRIYNDSDSDGKATIKAAAAQKYTNFTNAYKAFYDKLGVANNYITSNLFDGLNTKLITNMAGLEYIKAALVDGDTVVKGGLILSTLIALRNDKGNVTAGINGADTKENGIALWLGGKAIDKQASTTTEEEKKIAAKSLLRFDGTGYFANGNLWWDADGTLHADPTSFIINKNNVGVQLALFAPVWKSGTTDTTKLENVLSIDPQKPFTHLDVSGNVTTEGSLKIGGIYLSYDSANNALRLSKDAAGKEAANFYATGGITAYGAGASTTGGGGGLNSSVKSYSNALKLTSESLSEIASAYSIKALDSRISSLEGGSATAISVSGSGNAVTSVTKNGTTISVVKGSTFLTSHQSLDGYVNAISVSGSGNAITSVSKSGKGITFTKGATFLTSHQSLANYYTKSSVDSLLSGKSATSHTHSVKINGVTKTIAATGGTAVDLGTYLTSHQSLADYAKKSEIPTKVSQLTNDTGYITSSGSCAYATSAGNADKVDGVHVTWAGVLTSTSHLVAWESDGSALRDINPANVTVGNSDKLDGIHANGLLTALSNSDKGISITVGGTTKSISNISVNYASSAGNADTVDGEHLIKNGSGTGIKQVYYFNTQGNNTSYIKLGTLNTVSVTGYGTSKVMFTVKGGIDFGRTNESVYEVAASTRGSIQVTSTLVRGNRELKFGYVSTSSNVEIWMAYDGTYRGVTEVEVSSSVNFTLTMTETTTKPSGFVEGFYRILAATADNVASATKLAAARTIWGQSFDGTGNVDGTLTITNSGSDDPHIISTVNKWFHIVSKYKLVLYAGDYNSSQRDAINILSNHNVGIGVDPSYKLHVAGDIYSSATIRTAAQNQAIILSNDASPAWISALEGQVIFNTGKAIRFGETAWDWNQWAGLKYNHSDKTIYLGIANGSIFNANSPQSDGTLRLAGIKTVTPDSGARIGGSGSLYIGNANNSGWVYVQDMCSQVNSSYWNITQNGSAIFKSLTVNDVISCNSISVSKNAVIAGNLSVNGLINNKGILPTNYEVNNKGTNCYVSADELCSGITAITDSIPVDNLSIVYSNDNGTNWTNYNISNDTKFKAYANVAGIDGLTLGGNVITGNNDAEKLAQIKKNQLMFTFDVPNNCYSQVYFASVDITQGVGVTCTVEYLNSKGVIVNTFIKYMNGWNQFNYINLSNGNEGLPVGNDSRRYIRFKFKHDQNTTELRNASINKIRIFAFTKYSFPTDRFMGHTGHIYNFDYNMNTYFPNSILAKGGVTAYQSSDIRLKQDLRKLDYLGIIKAMGGTFGFAWKKDNTRSIGWIAQHVLCNPHLKDIVETDEKGYYKINYWSPKLIATAFGAIEQVGDEVSRLKARVVFLESEVQRLSGDKEDCNKKRLDNKNINSLN
jgi:hypothetical protein